MKFLGMLVLSLGIAGGLLAQPIDWGKRIKQIMEQQAAEKAQEKADTEIQYFVSAYLEALFDVAHNNGASLSSPARGVAPRVVVPGTSMTFTFTPVFPTALPFYNYFSAATVRYNPLLPAGTTIASPTTVQPVAPADFQLVFLDGTGNSLVALDIPTLTVVSQVVVPSTAGPFGIRPSPTSASSEVWVANGGQQVSVVDLQAQNLVTNIVTPSVPVASTPAGIVFTPDGATAFEALAYGAPDSSGSPGALITFDAANRKVTSTLPLTYGPSAILIAPDGLTVYLLNGSGQLTYYDVLSGTAGLSLSTYTPGKNGGYGGGQVYIHPDGTKLLWNINYLLEVFDLNTHTLVNEFNSGLPSTVASAMTVSQDGQRAYFTNALGNIAIVDTQTGAILETYNTGVSTALFAGPPVVQ